jgi:hypothetical protein
MLEKMVSMAHKVFRIGRQAKGEMPVEKEKKEEPEESNTEPIENEEIPEEKEPGEEEEAAG